MTILAANDLRHRYGIREILRGSSLSIHARERLGMVGRNGSGKTTLVRVLAGELVPDEGAVVRRAGLRVGTWPRSRPRAVSLTRRREIAEARRRPL